MTQSTELTEVLDRLMVAETRLTRQDRRGKVIVAAVIVAFLAIGYLAWYLNGRRAAGEVRNAGTDRRLEQLRAGVCGVVAGIPTGNPRVDQLRVAAGCPSPSASAPRAPGPRPTASSGPRAAPRAPTAPLATRPATSAAPSRAPPASGPAGTTPPRPVPPSTTAPAPPPTDPVPVLCVAVPGLRIELCL
jgi:hypothetical protein